MIGRFSNFCSLEILAEGRCVQGYRNPFCRSESELLFDFRLFDHQTKYKEPIFMTGTRRSRSRSRNSL
jgi:hypothetical protein